MIGIPSRRWCLVFHIILAVPFKYNIIKNNGLMRKRLQNQCSPITLLCNSLLSSSFLLYLKFSSQNWFCLGSTRTSSSGYWIRSTKLLFFKPCGQGVLFEQCRDCTFFGYVTIISTNPMLVHACC